MTRTFTITAVTHKRFPVNRGTFTKFEVRDQAGELFVSCDSMEEAENAKAICEKQEAACSEMGIDFHF